MDPGSSWLSRMIFTAWVWAKLIRWGNPPSWNFIFLWQRLISVSPCLQIEVQSQSGQTVRFSYHQLALSHNEELVALYLDNSVLRVASLVDGVSLDVRMEFDFSRRAVVLGGGGAGISRVSSLPSGLVWLDNSTLALQWPNFVVIVDMEKDIYELFYPSLVHLQPEVCHSATFCCINSFIMPLEISQVRRLYSIYRISEISIMEFILLFD